MKYLLYLLLILFPLGQLGRLNILNSEIVFHLNDIVVGLIAAVWLFSKHKQNSLLKPLIYFLIAGNGPWSVKMTEETRKNRKG